MQIAAESIVGRLLSLALAAPTAAQEPTAAPEGPAALAPRTDELAQRLGELDQRLADRLDETADISVAGWHARSISAVETLVRRRKM